MSLGKRSFALVPRSGRQQTSRQRLLLSNGAKASAEVGDNRMMRKRYQMYPDAFTRTKRVVCLLALRCIGNVHWSNPYRENVGQTGRFDRHISNN